VDRGLYVRPGIPELMRDRVVPAARIITPNQFELESLTGMASTTLDEVLRAADAARTLGPEIVLVTSVVHVDAVPDTIDMIAVSADAAWLVRTPLLPRTFTGAGDVTAATFLAQILAGARLPDALATTAAVIFGVLDTTIALGREELALVAAQEEFVQPSNTFEATRLR